MTISAPGVSSRTGSSVRTKAPVQADVNMMLVAAFALIGVAVLIVCVFADYPGAAVLDGLMGQ